MKNKSQYKISDNLYICECGRQFNSSQSLNAHFSHCDYHHKCLGTKRKGHYTEIHHTNCWENKTKEDLKEINKKISKTIKEKYNSRELIPGFTGKHHSEEFKQNARNRLLNKIKENGHIPNFSEKACEYIDYLNKKNGWNLQHALNGGEIICLGYWLDGYDKDLNIVFEYDEPKHYKDKENNILKDKDIERQNEIIENLHCKFYRYNEYLDLLYEVN